jgi:hypothetical protein
MEDNVATAVRRSSDGCTGAHPFHACGYEPDTPPIGSDNSCAGWHDRHKIDCQHRCDTSISLGLVRRDAHLRTTSRSSARYFETGYCGLTGNEALVTSPSRRQRLHFEERLNPIGDPILTPIRATNDPTACGGEAHGPARVPCCPCDPRSVQLDPLTPRLLGTTAGDMGDLGIPGRRLRVGSRPARGFEGKWRISVGVFA